MHYCMGKLADWGLGHKNSKTCGQCGMEKTESKDNGCCKDEYKFLKDDSAQKVTQSNLQLIQLMATALPSAYIQLPEIAFPSLTEESPNSNACLLYTSDAADERSSVDLGGRRIIKKKNHTQKKKK